MGPTCWAPPSGSGGSCGSPTAGGSRRSGTCRSTPAPSTGTSWWPSGLSCTCSSTSHDCREGERIVSDAATTLHHLGVEPAESPLTPESWGKLGMWIFLAADAMSFGGILAAYGALRYSDPAWPVPSSILGIQLTAAMTFLLVCSSVTMVEALAGVRRGNQQRLKGFLALTILGGLRFISLQAF